MFVVIKIIRMNHLQFETSPYLLQHAHNPVDWYAWKPEAFERARAEDKPILVSIGYSTCHWCHVMERESFENEAVAEAMNANFVCIKVDREERPDVDHIYMEACQILTGGGGWPLNCFLTPDGRPFYAGTYFPPRPAHNRPSWVQLLEYLADVWRTKRADAEAQADRLLGHIHRNDGVFLKKIEPALGGSAAENQAFTPELLDNIFARMRDQFDRAEGGFGGAPKFPGSMSLLFLLEYQHFAGNFEAREHALLSLDKMIFGGIYDQLGGGFARYATDRAWLVPHFEKMLYDNALLVSVISEAYKLAVDGGRLTAHDSGRAAVYRETLEETLEYVRREMTHPDGGFYSAQDADSEGVEGKFFVWDKAEIEAALGEDAEVFCQFYDVTEEGNWEEKNILWRPVELEIFAQTNELDVAALREKLRVCREKLFKIRDRRVCPGLDDKILLGWNALMASAHAHAFAALGHEKYRAAAVRNVAFLQERFTVDGGRLTADGGGRRTEDGTPAVSPTAHRPPSAANRPPSTVFKHTWKDGVAQYDAFLEDYAYLIAALVDVYEVTFDAAYLARAGQLTEFVLGEFFDPESGLFFFTGKSQTDVPLRRKDLYDNATPSGNSTMARNLQRLGLLLDRRDWRELASKMLLAVRETVERYPLSFGRWASAMLSEVHPAHEIAVVGANAHAKANAINARFLPNKLVAASEAESAELPLLAGKTGGLEALIYVCHDYACKRPVESLDEFDRLVAVRQ